MFRQIRSQSEHKRDVGGIGPTRYHDALNGQIGMLCVQCLDPDGIFVAFLVPGDRDLFDLSAEPFLQQIE